MNHVLLGLDTWPYPGKMAINPCSLEWPPFDKCSNTAVESVLHYSLVSKQMRMSLTYWITREASGGIPDSNINGTRSLLLFLLHVVGVPTAPPTSGRWGRYPFSFLCHFIHALRHKGNPLTLILLHYSKQGCHSVFEPRSTGFTQLNLAFVFEPSHFFVSHSLRPCQMCKTSLQLLVQ